MKINSFVTALFLVFCGIQSNGQGFKLGKVTVAELEETSHPKDPSVSAAILFKTGEVHFGYAPDKGFEMVTEVKTRIKIYKKEGYDWANQAVSYYAGNNAKESVSFSDAVTYNLVGGKIEKTKLKSEGEFNEVINKYWNRKKITMPNVKEGTVVEYSYIIKSPRVSELKDWYFQTSIPVNYSSFEVCIPEYYVYNVSQKGYAKLNIIKSSKSNRLNLSNTISANNQNKLDYQEDVTTYVAENLPAMKDEAFVNNIDNYTTCILHELAMTRFPQSNTESYATDWETVTKKIYENEDFGAELNKTGYFEEDIKGILKGLTTQDEKIMAIYNFVKDKVKWNDFYGYACNEGVRKAYKEKTGNVAEINLMLTAMLRYAELTANPVLVSTRSNGIPLFPSRTGFNYVISAVETANGIILLDATEKYAMPNVLPVRDLNWMGRLIRKDGTSDEIDLISKEFSKEMKNLNVALKKEGVIEGKVIMQLTNHEAMDFRIDNLTKSKDSYLEFLENKNSNIEVTDYVRVNDSDLSKPIIETYSFKKSNGFEILNDKIYVSPLFFFGRKENPFKQEIREYPVDFSYPFQEKILVNIEIPEGYMVESLPKSINITTGENIGFFQYKIAEVGGNIQILVVTDIKESIVPVDYYDVLKDFFRQLVEKQNEKIILKKS